MGITEAVEKMSSGTFISTKKSLVKAIRTPGLISHEATSLATYKAWGFSKLDILSESVCEECIEEELAQILANYIESSYCILNTAHTN